MTGVQTCALPICFPVTIGGRDSAIVDVRRFYIITVANDTAEAVSLYGPDGVLDVTVLLDQATLALNINALNADGTFDNDYMAIAVSATQIGISSLVAGHKFTVTDGGGATAITVTSRELWITAKDVDTKFEVNYPMGFATSRGLTLQGMTYTAGGHGDFYAYVNGTAVTLNAAAATAASHVTEINTDLAAYGIYSCLRVTGAAVVWVYGDDNVDTLRWNYNAVGFAATSYTTWGSKWGVFPALTSDDVFQVFSQMKNLGELSTMVYQEAPVDGSTYCKLVFEYDSTTADLMGASHANHYRQSTILYIKTGNGLLDYWEASGGASDDSIMASGATSDLTDILNKWSGVYGTSDGTLGTYLS